MSMDGPAAVLSQFTVGWALLDRDEFFAMEHQFVERTELFPRERSVHQPWTLSDHYGYGEFPWHTDGAVARIPPRFVALGRVDGSYGGPNTELLDVRSKLGLAKLHELRGTVLRVSSRSGRRSYRCAYSEIDGQPILRWDERVCTVARGLKDLAFLLDGCEPTAVIEGWGDGRVLVFDNWKLLHRRPAVSHPTRRLWRSYLRL